MCAPMHVDGCTCISLLSKAAEDAEAATGSTFYDASSPYQSSAVLAAAWDAATTGYRVNAGGYSMASMVGALSMVRVLFFLFFLFFD